MKAKKIFLAALTIVCALVMFSSCGEKNNPTSIYYYRVSGNLTSAGSGFGDILSTIGGSYNVHSFQDAIDAVIGQSTNTPQDSKVIAACDAIDAKIKADTGRKYSGSVQVVRKQSVDDPGTLIKEYKY